MSSVLCPGGLIPCPPTSFGASSDDPAGPFPSLRRAPNLHPPVSSCFSTGCKIYPLFGKIALLTILAVC